MLLAIHMYIPGISVYFLDENSLGHIYFNVLFSQNINMLDPHFSMLS